MKTLIIGAHGKIGQRLAQGLAKSEAIDPVAFIRKEDQKAQFEEMGVNTLVENLEHSAGTLAQAMEGFDAVVFTAGSGASTGFDKTLEIDLYGAIKSIQAAEQKGVKRFVMVSAAGAGSDQFWPDSMRPYYIAKHLADEALKESRLDYTILRPTRLTDEDAAGKIKVSDDPKSLQSEIPRQAVAEAVEAALKDGSALGKVVEMSAGDQEITSALRKFG